METESGKAEELGTSGETGMTARRGVLAPLFLLTTIVLLAVDLLTKAWAWDYVPDQSSPVFAYPRVCVIEGFFYIAKVENTGTIWGLAQGFPVLLRVVRCVMVLALLLLAWWTRADEKLKLFALGLVLGGALGNLYDNFTHHNGAVRDFLDFWIPLPWSDKPYHYPTFNVADSAILIGAILLFWVFMREGKQDKKEAARGSSTPDTGSSTPDTGSSIADTGSSMADTGSSTGSVT